MKNIIFRRRIKNLLARLLTIFSSPIQLAALLAIRIIRPFITIRIGWINSTRLGHMAANMELYLCATEHGIGKPFGSNFDIWCCTQEHVCNRQLLKMWKRRLIILPRWALTFLAHFNLYLPGGSIHHIGGNNTDRDIYNLLDKSNAQLAFTYKEEIEGRQALMQLGIPVDAEFICLTVRDSEYLNFFYESADWSYHNHRNSNIQSYVLAAEALADRGYYVIRMGAKVLEPLNSNHPRVIDYASNGKRSDFMDIYLGAKCFFAISTSTGWDAVPLIFRRPIAYVNMVPLGWLFTFSSKFLAITKHHVSMLDGQELSLREIFKRGVGFCSLNSDYSANNVVLIDNTPEEIRDLVIEMAERLEGSFQPRPEDEALQSKFWEIFPSDAVDVNGVRLHGEIRARYGAAFLRNNPEWLLQF